MATNAARTCSAPLFSLLSSARVILILAAHANKTSAWSGNTNSDASAKFVTSRRDLLRTIPPFAAAAAATAAALPAMLPARPAGAAVTDETDAFAAVGSAYSGLGRFDPPATTRQQSTTAASDEFVIPIVKEDLKSSGGLGLELADIEFRTNRRVYVKSVRPNSLADRKGVKKGWVLVAVDGASAERTNAEGAAIMVSRSVRASADGESNNGAVLELRFRDPSAFNEQLKKLEQGQEVTTQVAPAGDTTQRNQDGSVKRGERITDQADQKLSVTQLIPPKLCRRGADVDDLLEISYLGTVVETGQVFDGSAIKVDGKAIPGRGNDVSLFFVLGKQPFGQFPPGFDVGLQGMCVGERRRVIVPPVLAYGSVGVPRRGIPPDATLQYDITLVSINGLATPQ